MPSVVHECVVDLFHHAPSLAKLLLEKVAGITLPPGEAVETNVALGEVIPKSYYADNVIQVQDTQGKIGAGIVVETQLNIDYEKHYSWPGYVTAIWTRLRCSAYLLVIAFDPAVARWCREPIRMGQPGLELWPIVIDYETLRNAVLTKNTEPIPELIVLSALIRSKRSDALNAAIESLQQLDALTTLATEQRELYADYIVAALDAVAQTQLEEAMQTYPFRSEFAKRHYSLGRQEGRQEGVQALIRAAEKRFGPLSDEHRTLIHSKTVEAGLEAVLTYLVTATGANDFLVMLRQPTDSTTQPPTDP